MRINCDKLRIKSAQKGRTEARVEGKVIGVEVNEGFKVLGFGPMMKQAEGKWCSAGGWWIQVENITDEDLMLEAVAITE